VEREGLKGRKKGGRRMPFSNNLPNKGGAEKKRRGYEGHSVTKGRVATHGLGEGKGKKHQKRKRGRGVLVRKKRNSLY